MILGNKTFAGYLIAFFALGAIFAAAFAFGRYIVAPGLWQLADSSSEQTIVAKGGSERSAYFSARDFAGTEMFGVRRNGGNQVQMSVFDDLAIQSRGPVSGKLQGFRGTAPPFVCHAGTAATTWLDTRHTPNRLYVCAAIEVNGYEWAEIPLIFPFRVWVPVPRLLKL